MVYYVNNDWFIKKPDGSFLNVFYASSTKELLVYNFGKSETRYKAKREDLLILIKSIFLAEGIKVK